MKIQITSWRDGYVLFEGEFESLLLAVEEAVRKGADLCSADLRSADLRSADLRSANLCSADLRSADLRSADLRSANLRSADLRSADLRSADLRSAKGLDRNRTQPLMMLLDQPGKIRAYKLVTTGLKSPLALDQGHEVLLYEMGSTVEQADCDEDPSNACGAGLHVATLPWCLSEHKTGQKILIVEFEASDIACIPNDTSGKFRVRKLTVIGEKQIPEIGNLESEEGNVEK